MLHHCEVKKNMIRLCEIAENTQVLQGNDLQQKVLYNDYFQKQKQTTDGIFQWCSYKRKNKNKKTTKLNY